MSYEEQLARCDCCGLEVRYLDLKVVRVELPLRHVGSTVVVEPHVIYRPECRDCQETD
jgi:hypothetical protein